MIGGKCGSCVPPGGITPTTPDVELLDIVGRLVDPELLLIPEVPPLIENGGTVIPGQGGGK